MLRLKDPILTEPQPPDGIDPLPSSEPESPEMPIPYVAYAGANVMTSKELGAARSEAIPPPPAFDLYGYRVSHMTDRFLLSRSTDAYRIWKFRSAEPAVEFPVTNEGWAEAWTTFRKMESQPA